MTLHEDFLKAADDVKKLKSSPSNDDLLEIYGLYKQATVGDNNTDRPGMLDMKGKAKWDSWTAKKGVNQDSAKEQYVAKVKSLISSIGLIYLVGGCTEFQRFSQDLLSYNPVTGEWNTLQSMSVARSQMGVAVLDDYLYVVGGNNKSQVLSSVERYSFRKGTWSTVPSMSVGRSGPAVAAVDGLLYVIGGYETVENPFYRAQFTVASVECFNPFANSWSDCPPLPESRAEAGVVVL
ncbi:hypothetical protein FQR65_LT02687 [Abscondita terminalis]|nr:hypothetical protein FQR65_LT02687 [Abscondita terminalis]